MQMIFRHVPFNDQDIVLSTDFSDQVSDSLTYFPGQHWSSVLRDPDDVQMYFVDGMCAVSIFAHAVNLSKPAKAVA
jgi:hypothetical protein